MSAPAPATLHDVLDRAYTRDAADRLLASGEDPNARRGPLDETPLHVAVRRRRVEIIEPLVTAGAVLDATTRGGMTAYRHARRRGFTECAGALAALGCDTRMTEGDALAVALLDGDLATARARLARRPALARAKTPEEARLLPDLAGFEGRAEAVALLLDHGADIEARGLDGGTALHQACWFGAPASARLLLERGAPLGVLCEAHRTTPLGWVAHGSRYSGDAEARAASYVAITEMLLDAGAEIPGKDVATDREQLAGAAEPVVDVLRRHGFTG